MPPAGKRQKKTSSHNAFNPNFLDQIMRFISCMSDPDINRLKK